MVEHKGKIGVREFFAILAMTIGPKYGDDTPAILYKNLDTAAWMAPLIIGFITVIPIYLLIKVLSSFENKGLSDVIEHLFGKIFGFLLLAILWLISITALTFDTAIYTDIVTIMYFSETPVLAIYAILMLICAYGAKKGIEQIGSVAWITLFWVKISLFSVLFIIIFQGEIEFLFPLFGPGKWEVLKESAYKTSIYADMLFIGLIYPLVASKSAYSKGTWFALIFIILEHVFSLIGYMMLFDFHGIKNMNFPFHEAIRYIHLGFLPNVETFFFPFWIVSSFVRFSFYLYLSAILFGSLFKIKHFDYLIPIIATLVLSLGMIPENSTNIIFYLREKFINIVTPFFIILPFIIWLIAKFKGVLNHDNSKTG
ncbi:endospore germination permease [Bacillus sp. Bva_UNVM-123]|uniref:endospore germination permease n=1 Tax=Bacillus sp. Bva_UNVM-123 TaxID=2829798 RepID=UPI00391EF656